jgi:hypothetical protein
MEAGRSIAEVKAGAIAGNDVGTPVVGWNEDDLSLRGSEYRCEFRRSDEGQVGVDYRPTPLPAASFD